MRCLLLALLLVLIAGPAHARPPGALVMLAGGGSEGEPGDAHAWSARLYRHLLDHGDVTGDGRVVVAVISAHAETDFIPRYFRWLGADEAVNVTVATRADAASAATLAAVERADAVFLKGGDQGVYYRMWNDTPLEAALRRLVQERHGAIGGTSAGAMSLAEVALAGGKSPTSADVLADALTPELDDLEGGSALHTDFLGFVPGVTIDTHFTERARLGRLMGVLARAADELRRPDLLGIGVSEQTGVVIEDGRARVIGRDSVWFVRASHGARPWRRAGRPLAYAPLDADVLVDGWSYDLQHAKVGPPPPSAVPAVSTASGQPDQGELEVAGSDAHAADIFELAVQPKPFDIRRAERPGCVHDAVGFADAQGERRGFAQEAAVRALYAQPGAIAVLLGSGAVMTRAAATPGKLAFGPRAAAIVVDARAARWKGLSPEVSSMDAGDGSLHSAALTGLSVGAYGATSESGVAFRR